MAVKYDRAKAREELAKRTKESEERREGETLAKYFQDDLDVSFVKFPPTKEDPHIFDIIPFRAGGNMPNYMKVKEGRWAYYLDIYVHQNIGPAKTWIVCPSKNYGEPCPICEMIDDLVQEGKEYEDYATIAPKRRCVYNVVNMTTEKEEAKGVQIWEVAYKYSEKQIQTAARAPRGGGVVSYADPDKDVGQSISIMVDKDTYKTISGHKLVPRDYDISDKILEQAVALDQIIVRLSYEEIARILRRSEDSEVNAETDNNNEDDVPLNVAACPGGGKFGVDFDRLSYCDDCDDFRACRKENDSMQQQEKNSRPSRQSSPGGRPGRGKI